MEDTNKHERFKKYVLNLDNRTKLLNIISELPDENLLVGTVNKIEKIMTKDEFINFTVDYYKYMHSKFPELNHMKMKKTIYKNDVIIYKPEL